MQTDDVPMDEPMRDTLLRPVNQLQSLARALFETLSSSQTPPDPPVAALAACDEQLAEALRKSRTHLLKQRRIEALLAEVHELDVQLLEIIETLGHGQNELAAIIEEGEERVRAADAATKSAISYTSLISYATKVADYTSAPPAAAIDPKAPHQPQPYAFRPPFPQEAVLSRSRLMGGGPIGPIGEFQPIGEAINVQHEESTASNVPRPRLPAEHISQPVQRRPRNLNMGIFDLDLNPDMP